MIYQFIFSLIGGWISRMCGGGRPHLPWGFEQILFAIPYGLLFTGSLWGVPSFFGALYGKRTGHGQYIHLGYLKRQPYANDESLDWIVRFFMGYDYGGNYWRCVAGLAVTGVALTIIPGICYAIAIDPCKGFLLGISGALKAPAYMIGWFLWDKNVPVKPTVIGEILTGVFGWGVLSCFL